MLEGTARARRGTRGTDLLVRAAVLGAAALLSTAPAALADPPPGSPAYGHPYRHGAVPTRESAHNAGTATTSSANLNYGGGITSNTYTVGVTTGAPKVYLVFWGSQWGTSTTDGNGKVTFSGDSAGMAPYLQSFLKGIGGTGDSWSGVMTQYCQGVAKGAQTCPASAAHVGYPNGSAFADVWYDGSTAAPSQANGNQIGAEAVRAAAHFGNATQDANLPVQYVIVSPHGTHPDGFNTLGGNFCAWHDYTGDATLSGGAVSSPAGQLAFTNFPYIPDMGSSCGQSFVNAGSAGALDGVSIVEGHEYAETITDTWPAGGWTDSTGYENGDKCAWNPSGQTVKSQNVTFTTGKFAMQPTWGNDGASGAGACEISHATVTSGSPPPPTANTVTVTNPGAQSATANTAIAPLQIQASDSASGQTLTYAASGLPAGLAINTSGQITGTPTTTGTYSVTVTATDGTGASGSASFTWTVNPAGTPGCTTGQLLGNPGFETGALAPWSATAGVLNGSGAGQPAHSGSYLAWLDGYGTTHTDTLAQTVSIPSGCKSSTLSFWLHIDTAETTTTSKYDTLTVQLLNSSGTVLTTLQTYSNLNAAAGYVQRSFNVGTYAGQAVTVKFTGTENSSRQTSFVIDDTALNAS